MADVIEAIADLIGDLFQAFPRMMTVILLILIIGIATALVVHYRNQDLRFDVQELHISCTGSKGSTELECQPQTGSSSNGTPCITWPKAYQANFGPRPVQICTRKGVVKELAIAEQDDRYRIQVSDRVGFVYKADFTSSE